MAWIMTSDPVDDFLRYDAEQEELPCCDFCGRQLEEYAYHINGEWLCKDCMESQYMEEVRND